jgi:hypothetical protein
MKVVSLSPQRYHADHKFNPLALPDLRSAGPVSASVLSSSKDPVSFLLGQKFERSPAMDWGNLVDCLYLTPDLWSSLYVMLPPDAPEPPTKAMLEAKKPGPESLSRQLWWAEFESKRQGREVVKPEVMREVQAAVSMLQQHSLAERIYQESCKQVALMGENPLRSGSTAKGLMDLIPMEGEFQDAIVDLKTTSDLEEDQLMRTSWRFEYPMKLAWYGLLSEAAGLGPRPRGVLVWQRSKWPYDVKVREIDPHDMDIGRMMAKRRMERLATLDRQALRSYYDTSLKVMSLADWQRNSYLRE